MVPFSRYHTKSSKALDLLSKPKYLLTVKKIHSAAKPAAAVAELIQIPVFSAPSPQIELPSAIAA